MFKDSEIIQRLHSTEEMLSNIGAVLNLLLQKLATLQEQVEYLADAEEARATHSKKPTRKSKVEEMNNNG